MCKACETFQNKSCANCCHFLDIEDFHGQVVYRCKLTRALLKGTPCKLFNTDISSEKICINCREYLGGGDWGLACNKHYHSLPEALSEACEDFVRIKG